MCGVLGVLALTLAGPASFAQTPAPVKLPGSAVFAVKPALAGQTTLESGHFRYDVTSGAALDDAVDVYNLKSAPLTLRVYAVDIITAEGGGLAPAQPEDPKNGVGSWISVARDSVVIPAKQSVRVAFSLQVPATIAPGDYTGAMVASTIAAKTASGVAVETRAALMVNVRVQGTASLAAVAGALAVTGSGPDKRFSVTVRNTGNLLGTVRGVVTIAAGSRRVAVASLKPQGIYVIPGGAATFRGRWRGPATGTRVAQAVFEVTSAGVPAITVRSKRVTLRFTPVRFALLVLGFLGLLALAFRRRIQLAGWWRRRSDSWPVETEDHWPEPDDAPAPEGHVETTL